jgi:competence protein ComEA
VFEFTPGQRIALGTLAVAALLAMGMWLYELGRHHAPMLTAEPPPKAEELPVVLVHVAGAVTKPGLYSLPGGARVADALEAAGGARPDALTGELNLAAKLRDGLKLTVPAAADPPGKTIIIQEDIYEHAPPGQAPAPPTPESGAEPPEPIDAGEVAKTDGDSDSARASGHAGRKEPPTAPIDLNTASLETLQRLPGVGEKTAARIIGYRETRGHFTKIEDLMNVKGIGPKTFERLKPYLKVGG